MNAPKLTDRVSHHKQHNSVVLVVYPVVLMGDTASVSPSGSQSGVPACVWCGSFFGRRIFSLDLTSDRDSAWNVGVDNDPQLDDSAWKDGVDCDNKKKKICRRPRVSR